MIYSSLQLACILCKSGLKPAQCDLPGQEIHGELGCVHLGSILSPIVSFMPPILTEYIPMQWEDNANLCTS